MCQYFTPLNAEMLQLILGIKGYQIKAGGRSFEALTRSVKYCKNCKTVVSQHCPDNYTCCQYLPMHVSSISQHSVLKLKIHQQCGMITVPIADPKGFSKIMSDRELQMPCVWSLLTACAVLWSTVSLGLPGHGDMAICAFVLVLLLYFSAALSSCCRMPVWQHMERWCVRHVPHPWLMTYKANCNIKQHRWPLSFREVPREVVEGPCLWRDPSHSRTWREPSRTPHAERGCRIHWIEDRMQAWRCVKYICL